MQFYAIKKYAVKNFKRATIQSQTCPWLCLDAGVHVRLKQAQNMITSTTQHEPIFYKTL